MTRTESRYRHIWDQPAAADRTRAAFATLGSSIRRLAPALWTERMLLAGAPDRDLKELTATFPARLRKDKTTHPLFVLRPIGSYGHKVCPCSSRDWNAKTYIRRGCELEITGKITDRTSYLVETCAFNLPLNPEFTRRLRFLGRVPEACLEQRLP